MSNPTGNEHKDEDFYNRIKKLAESTRKYLTIKPNTGMTLTFDANKAKEALRTYKGNDSWCVEYTVKTEDNLEKLIRFALKWSENINLILREKGGYAKIKCIRSGDVENTNYTFIPV